MPKTLKPNGFGSWKVGLHVIVEKPYDEVLIMDGWEVIQSDAQSTTFLFHYSNSRKGDDEGAIFTLGNTMPNGVPLDAYSVDWDSSTY